MSNRLFSVGHSNHSFEDFTPLLMRHGVTMLVDVRSSPFSRYATDFNRDALENNLARVGIAYTFLGDQLGGRPTGTSCYTGGKVDYRLVARTPAFKEGMAQLTNLAESHVCAVMCSEKDPLNCHRFALVCREVVRAGLDCWHIMSDGKAESHAMVVERMMSQLNVDMPLFPADDTAVDLAYQKLGRKIAYGSEQDDDVALLQRRGT